MQPLHVRVDQQGLLTACLHSEGSILAPYAEQLTCFAVLHALAHCFQVQGAEWVNALA